MIHSRQHTIKAEISSAFFGCKLEKWFSTEEVLHSKNWNTEPFHAIHIQENMVYVLDNTPEAWLNSHNATFQKIIDLLLHPALFGSERFKSTDNFPIGHNVLHPFMYNFYFDKEITQMNVHQTFHILLYHAVHSRKGFLADSFWWFLLVQFQGCPFRFTWHKFLWTWGCICKYCSKCIHDGALNIRQRGS